MIKDFFYDYRVNLNNALASVDMIELERAFNLLDMYGKKNFGGRIFVCGNGGSASIAEHFTCDHAKGTRQDTFRTPEVISLSSNMAVLTAIANDMSYADVFSYQMKMHNRNPNDLLVVISASGNSPNVVEAFQEAIHWNLHTIAMVGFDGGDVRKTHMKYRLGSKLPLSAILHVKSENYGVIEDCHQILMHSLAQAIHKQHVVSDYII